MTTSEHHIGAIMKMSWFIQYTLWNRRTPQYNYTKHLNVTNRILASNNGRQLPNSGSDFYNSPRRAIAIHGTNADEEEIASP